jgi:hypothetical protein
MTGTPYRPAPAVVAVGVDGDTGGGTTFSLDLPGPLVFEDTIIAFINMSGDFDGADVEITGTGGQFWFQRPGQVTSTSVTSMSAGVWSHFITEADEAGMTTMDFTTDLSVDELAAVFYVIDSHHSEGQVQMTSDQGNTNPDIRYQGPHFYLTPSGLDFHVETRWIVWSVIFGNAYVSSYGPPETGPNGWTYDGIAQFGNTEIFVSHTVGGLAPPYVEGVSGPTEPPNYGEEVIIESSGTPGVFLPGYVTYFGGAVEPPLAGLDEFPGPFCAPGDCWTWDAWGTPENCKNALGFINPSPGETGYGLAVGQSYSAHYHSYTVDIEEDVPYWGMLCTPAEAS